MRKEIEMAFAARYPTAKPMQINKKVKTYVDEVVRALAQSNIAFGIQNGDEFSLGVFDLRERVGRITIDGKQQWVLGLLSSNPETALYTVGFKGNEGQVSRVSLSKKYEKQIMEEMINLNLELSPKQLKAMHDNATNWIPCDLDSLNSFITNTSIKYAEEVRKNDPDRGAYRDALARNMLIARQLIAQSSFHEGQSVLPEVYWTADSGRMYGKGLSLQRVPKDVRNAALGVCHSYDFKASCYALMTGLALAIDPTLKVASMIEYIKDRSEIRKTIAEELGIEEDKVKGIFSSLGFGAKLVDNPYMSIRKELGPIGYEQLMANKEFHYISQAFKLVKATILEHFSSDNFTFMGLKYNPIDPNSDSVVPKKRNKNQKLAWIYQAMESKAIADFGSMASEYGYQPALFAHDCVYFKTKLPEIRLASIHSELRREFPLLSFEYELVIPIFNGEGPFKAKSNAYKNHQVAHESSIDAEELNADSSFVKFDEHKIDPLDVRFGIFSEQIKALNGSNVSRGGTSFDLNARLAARD